jgi:hypothetical protein
MCINAVWHKGASFCANILPDTSYYQWQLSSLYHLLTAGCVKELKASPLTKKFHTDFLKTAESIALSQQSASEHYA